MPLRHRLSQRSQQEMSSSTRTCIEIMNRSENTVGGILFPVAGLANACHFGGNFSPFILDDVLPYYGIVKSVISSMDFFRTGDGYDYNHALDDIYEEEDRPLECVRTIKGTLEIFQFIAMGVAAMIRGKEGRNVSTFVDICFAIRVGQDFLLAFSDLHLVFSKKFQETQRPHCLLIGRLPSGLNTNELREVENEAIKNFITKGLALTGWIALACGGPWGWAFIAGEAIISEFYACRGAKPSQPSHAGVFGSMSHVASQQNPPPQHLGATASERDSLVSQNAKR